MSAAETLRTLLAGQRPAEGVLQTLRLSDSVGEYYGEEAVLERCRAAPMDLADAEIAYGDAQVALFGPARAAVADVHGDHVGRIWAVGSAKPGQPEPAVAVAFDPDLHQARGGVIWGADEHPAASPGLLAALAAAGDTLVDSIARTDGDYRVRAVLIRAFGTEDRGVGLYALHRLGRGPTRQAAWSHAAVLIAPDHPRVVRDAAARSAPLIHRL